MYVWGRSLPGTGQPGYAEIKQELGKWLPQTNRDPVENVE